MSVEANSGYVNGLNASWPAAGDTLTEGDDHLRMLKTRLLNTLPNITGAITLTQTDLNNAVLTTGTQTVTGDKTLSGNTTLSGTANVISGATTVTSHKLVNSVGTSLLYLPFKAVLITNVTAASPTVTGSAGVTVSRTSQAHWTVTHGMGSSAIAVLAQWGDSVVSSNIWVKNIGATTFTVEAADGTSEGGFSLFIAAY